MSITFLASFPAIQSAIKVDGSGGGMRIQLDIPESEMAEAVALLGLREMMLRVTVEPVLKNTKEQDAEEVVATGRERKSRRTPAKK